MEVASREFRHPTPDELLAALDADSSLLEKWNGLTELGRNEWICWMTSAKKQETRDARFARLRKDVLGGKRRPCCWPGCPHRNAAAQKYF